MQDYYIGQVGLKPDLFWNSTWKEVILMGESWQINHNLEWEKIRYLSSTILNARAQKASQLIRSDKLFKLPQDVYLERGKPATDKESFERFKEICKAKGITFSDN